MKNRTRIGVEGRIVLPPPKKHMCKPESSVFVNVNLFGSRVFADVIKHLEMRSF